MLTESTVAICVTVTLTSLLWTPPLTPSSQLVHSAQFVFPLCLGNRVVALEDNFLCGNASKAARWSFCGYTATMSSMPLNIHIHCEQEIEGAFFFFSPWIRFHNWILALLYMTWKKTELRKQGIRTCGSCVWKKLHSLMASRQVNAVG